ncbi:hypothetical protein D3C76_1690830 [compost metagenome]
MRQHLRVETLQGETEHQHRDNDDPAPHTEQPGQHAGAGAEQQIEHKFHQRLPVHP